MRLEGVGVNIDVRTWAGIRWALALLAVGVMQMACVGSMLRRGPEVVLAPVTRVNVPSWDYHTVAWVGDRLVVQYQPDPDDANIFTVRLGLLSPEGEAVEPLALPKHPRCGPDGLNGYYAPTALPDGRLGYVVDCRPKDDVWAEFLYMMAYDLATGEVEQLLDYPLPTEFVGTGGFAWNPEMTRGITGEGRGRYIAEELFWFTRESWERVDLPFAQSYGPSWSPDGKTIAFVAAEERGAPMVFTFYDIYLMDADGRNLRRVVEGTWATPGTSFSPDGRWLAFPASFSQDTREEEQGLYLLHVDSGRLFMVGQATRYFSVPSWSPDGRRIVVANDVSEDLYNPLSEILILEVGAILDSLVP